MPMCGGNVFLRSIVVPTRPGRPRSELEGTSRLRQAAVRQARLGPDRLRQRKPQRRTGPPGA